MPHQNNLHEKFPSLFHYTTAEGLSGILRSQTLWATDYRFLNDSMELKACTAVLLDEVSSAVEEKISKYAEDNVLDMEEIERVGGIHSFALNESRNVLDAMFRGNDGIFHSPFIASFSAALSEYVSSNGLLSQWRGYGKDGGYAIEFDTYGLQENISELQIVEFDSVIYTHEDTTIKVHFKEEIESIRKAVEALIESQIVQNPPQRMKVVENSQIPIMRLMTFIKHEAFCEECEVRVCSYKALSEVHELKHRTSNGMMVPYIELFAPVKDQSKIASEMHLPIKRIIVGPHRDQAQRVRALESLTEHVQVVPLGNSAIDVKKSDIPYIG